MHILHICAVENTLNFMSITLRLTGATMGPDEIFSIHSCFFSFGGETWSVTSSLSDLVLKP